MPASHFAALVFLPALLLVASEADAQCRRSVPVSRPAVRQQPSSQIVQERAYKCRGPNGEVLFSDTGCFGKTPRVSKSRTSSITSLEQSGVPTRPGTR